MIIPANDPRLTWCGILSLEQHDDWVKPWRVPHQDLDLYSPGANTLAVPAEKPSGVRLRFATDAAAMKLVCAPLAEDGSFDLVIDNKIVTTSVFETGASEVVFADLSAGNKTIEVWFPPTVPVAMRHLELPDGADIVLRTDDRPKWVTYGSSITHCRAAQSPATTWPGVVARARNLNLTSMGYGGQCHADPLIARLIRDRPADLVSIKLGINIYGQASLGPRAFRPAVLGTIATIRDGHPDIPLVVCSPIWGHDRETRENAVGLTLQQMRIEVAEAVESFARRGDDHIYYVDGLKLFDESMAQHMPDNLHPDARGYQLMGEHFLKEVFDVQMVAIGA